MQGGCNNYKPFVLLDGANGVGALKVNEIKSELENLLNIKVYNSGNGKLNDKCGADYIKVILFIIFFF